MLAGLFADSAAYAGGRTGLLRDRALVFVYAGNVHAHAAGALGTKLDDALGTGGGTFAAGGTLGFVDHWKAGDGIHAQGSELAGRNAVAAAETAEQTAGVTSVQGRLDFAALLTLVGIDAGTGVAGAVAADDRHKRSGFAYLAPQDGGDLLHNLGAAHGAVVRVEVARLDGGVGEGTASGESAAAAIGAGKSFFNVVNPGVLLNLELPGHPEEHQGQQKAENRKNHDGPDDSVGHFR